MEKSKLSEEDWAKALKAIEHVFAASTLLGEVRTAITAEGPRLVLAGAMGYLAGVAEAITQVLDLGKNEEAYVLERSQDQERRFIINALEGKKGLFVVRDTEADA